MQFKKIKNFFTTHKILSIISIYLIFLVVGIMRYPDIRNELKYFIISDNILKNDSPFILTYLGKLYPDKPPFYFWILSFLKRYSGDFFTPLTIILGTLAPSLLISIFSFKLFTKIKNENAGFLISLFLSTTPFFIGASLVIRMDMLMNLFIFFSLYLFFGVYYKFIKPSFIKITLIYILIFLGVFTKGIGGFIVPTLTILVFLTLEKNLVYLKKIKFIWGVFLIFSLFCLWGYFILKSPLGKEYIHLLLGQETVGRIIKSKAHIRPFYYYFKMLPLLLFPYGILGVFAIVYYIRDIKNLRLWTSLEKIGFSWAIPSLFAFSLASGKLDIYLLPTFVGFFVLIYSYILKNYKTKKFEVVLNLSLYLAIFPAIFNRVINREKKLYLKLLSLPLGIVFIISLLSPFTEIYNDKFLLKPIEKNIANSDKIIVAYKFDDFINMRCKIDSNIILFQNIKDIERLILEKREFLVVTRKKYSEDVSKFSGVRKKYENYNYTLYEFF